jgi:protein TonB
VPRLLLAILLALGLHLLLFRIIIPVREIQSPVVSGHSQVTVTLARPTPPLPETAEEKPEEAPSQPGQVVQEPAAVSLPAQKPPVVPAPRPAPEKRKKDPPVRMERTDHFAPAAPLSTDASRPATPPAGGAGEASAGPESVAANLRQAVPLAAVNRPPAYPALARKRGWEGRVLLAVEVAVDGTAQAVRVQTGSGHELLDEAALRAVRQWRFQPGTRAGVAVAMQVLVPVHFILKDSP